MSEEALVREIQTEIPKAGRRFSTPLILGAGLIILLGALTGYFLSSQKTLPGLGAKTANMPVSGKIEKGAVYGSNDLKTFKDTAEGQLEKGGIDGEGSHHLVRPGGESQTVYLTSSIIDLDLFAGRKVKVWGETNTARKAGWLMDVGRVEVLE